MLISQEKLHSLFDYNPMTGILIWKERQAVSNYDRTWNTKYAGRRAGCVRRKKTGYECRQVWIGGKVYQEHRVIWAWMLGSEPPSQIDHKDRNATNNVWSNIRDAEGRNDTNRSMRRDNQSGVTGVFWDKKSAQWCAVLYVNRKRRVIGRFSDLNAAKSAIEMARASHGFDPGHGIERAHYVRQAQV